MASHKFSPTRRSAGFTLIELMITVVIATVLISIAIPSYSKSIRKSRRTEAKSALLDIAGREERFFNTNNKYSILPSDIGYGAAGVPFPMPVGNSYYTVDVQLTNVAGVPGYTITATPVVGSDQAKDGTCAQFQLNNLGQQTSAPNTTDCWQ